MFCGLAIIYSIILFIVITNTTNSFRSIAYNTVRHKTIAKSFRVDANLPIILKLHHTTKTYTKLFLAQSSEDIANANSNNNQTTNNRSSITSIDEKKDEIAYRFTVLNSLSEIARDKWNANLPENCCPFLMYDWLYLLEKSGCVDTRAGWQPLHLIVTATKVLENNTEPISYSNYSVNNENIVAVIPLYAKYDSYGEFIFDQSWAQFAEYQLGIQYYPKLLGAVPFTPATGPRVLLNPKLSDSEKKYITILAANYLQQIVVQNKLSSANINFMLEKESDIFQMINYDLRETIQYRWHNFNQQENRKYTDFDDYLSCFKSKRRIKIKAERKKVYEEEGIIVDVVKGDSDFADEKFYLLMHKLYTTTVDKMWGSRYLNTDFFRELSKAPKDFRKNLVFIVARNPEDNRIIAGTINIASKSHLYGRYWGSFEFVNNLHFEVCYYKAIEYCIDNGIEYMEPGAGGGEFKFLRGFDPYIIRSVHWFRDKSLQLAVGKFLQQERDIMKEQKDYLVSNSAVKGKIPPKE